jgi:hypothetical protein
MATATLPIVGRKKIAAENSVSMESGAMHETAPQ